MHYTFRHFDEKIVVNVIGGYDYYDAVIKQIEIKQIPVFDEKG